MMNEMQFLCNKFRISEETFASDFIKEISHAWGNISSDMLDQELSKYFYSVFPKGCVKKNSGIAFSRVLTRNKCRYEIALEIYKIFTVNSGKSI